MGLAHRSPPVTQKLNQKFVNTLSEALDLFCDEVWDEFGRGAPSLRKAQRACMRLSVGDPAAALRYLTTINGEQYVSEEDIREAEDYPSAIRPVTAVLRSRLISDSPLPKRRPGLKIGL